MSTSFNQSYVGVRHDIIEMIPVELPGDITVLDVGCSNGVNGKFLREKGIAKELWGFEYSEEMAQVARQTFTKVFTGDIEAMDIEEMLAGKSFDLMIFGDILEHLKQPEHVLERLVKFLKDDGYVIISVPNMQHISAVYQLAVKGNWPDNDRGIFDRTHLRVVTRKTLYSMIHNSGMQVVRLRRNFRYKDAIGSKFPLLLRPFLKRIFKNYFTFQYVALAKPNGKAKRK